MKEDQSISFLKDTEKRMGCLHPEQKAKNLNLSNKERAERHDDDEGTEKYDRPFDGIMNFPGHYEISDTQQDGLMQNIKRHHTFIGSSQQRAIKNQKPHTESEDGKQPTPGTEKGEKGIYPITEPDRVLWDISL